MDVAGDGARDGLAEGLATFLAGVERGLEHGDGGLHGLGALDQLGEEELALAEEVADLFDALTKPLSRMSPAAQARVEAFLREALGVLDLAVDDALLHLLVQLFPDIWILLAHSPPCVRKNACGYQPGSTIRPPTGRVKQEIRGTTCAKYHGRWQRSK